MNISIVCVGRLKEKYWADAMSEYTKRLAKYCTFSVAEVKEEKAPENLSAAQERLVKETEGRAVQNRIRKGSYVIALDIAGKQLSSEDLSGQIQALAVEGKSSIVFMIGGSLGLSAEVLSIADMRLSFSQMTFPHQMARIILTEQIYRAFKIIKNEAYHK